MDVSPEWETVFSADYDIKYWSKIGQPDDIDQLILGWAKENDSVILTNDFEIPHVRFVTCAISTYPVSMCGM